MYNNGSETNLSLSIDQSASHNDSIGVYLEHTYIIVEENSSAKFSVLLVASEHAMDGLTSTFTVVAESFLDGSNNFITFEVTITTQPPPKFTENVCCILLQYYMPNPFLNFLNVRIMQSHHLIGCVSAALLSGCPW